MTGSRIDAWPFPAAEWSVELLDPRFETAEYVRSEDELRARRLRKQANRHGGEWGRNALSLADRIDPNSTPSIPVSLASSRHMRDTRIRFTGALLRLLASVDTTRLARVDIVKPSLCQDLIAFIDENPGRAMNQLRTDLLRNGAHGPDGFAVGVYHNEYDPIGQVFQGHAHLLVFGSYVEAVDKMRDMRGYRATERVKRPIWMQSLSDGTDRAHALSYLLKSFIPSKPLLPLGANGGLKRPRQGSRLPEPYHCQYLMWIDQFKLADLCIFMGLTLTSDGLIFRT